MYFLSITHLQSLFIQNHTKRMNAQDRTLFVLYNANPQLQMQNDPKNSHQNKLLKLILGDKKVQQLQQLSILLVGVGGIGCQVLKSLTRLPVKQITIIDLDTIQTSNLNRQFYFHPQHISHPKSLIAAEQIKTLLPDINLHPIYGNIYHPEYNNYTFYSKFDYVISALDNMKARQFLAQNCTKYGKTLIDAGTAGYFGQSYVSQRFVTSCHNCSASKDQQQEDQNAAVCTIRSRPQKSLHCAVYAKYIFEKIFSTSQNHPQEQSVFNKINKQLLHKDKPNPSPSITKSKAIQLFDYLFNKQFQQLMNSENYELIQRLQYQQVVKQTINLSQINKMKTDDEDSIWPINLYAKRFISSFCSLVDKYRKNIMQRSNDPFVYEKDDTDCNIFITCVCNLRIYNFKKPSSQQSKLKYLTLYECRKLIGKVIAAIASTNSIAASLQVKQLIDLLKESSDIERRYYTISPIIHERVSYSWLSLPNPQCRVCSPMNLYFCIECDLGRRTFQQFEEYALQRCFSFGRDVYCGSLVLVKNVNAYKQSANKKKPLNFKPQLIIKNTLTLCFLPSSKLSQLKVEVTLIHRQNHQEEQKKEKFTIINQPDIDKTLTALETYRITRQKHEQISNQQNSPDYQQQYPHLNTP